MFFLTLAVPISKHLFDFIFVPICMGVHGLGQPIKPGQTHPKNPKKWVVLGNWVGMVSENGKPMKINGFRVKPDSNPKNSLTQ